MADVLAVTLTILGLLLTLPAQWLLLAALFPAAVDRSRGRVLRSPVLSLFVGLGAAVLLLVLPLTLVSQGGPPMKVLGILGFAAGMLLAGVGLAGLSRAVGERLPSPGDLERPWRPLVRGAACLELAFLFPVVGWFGVLPLAVVEAVGAAALAILAPSRGPAPLPAAPAPAA